MLSLKRVSIFETVKLNKIMAKYRKNISDLNFYSDFNGRLLSYIIVGDVYFITSDKGILGVIINDNISKLFHYIPIDNSISILKLLHLLSKYFHPKDYSITLNYKDLNYDDLKNFFSLTITENMMYMHIETSNRLNTPKEDTSLLTRNLIINKEESIRVELQNKIFNNVENRILLTLDEVLDEQISPKFLKNFCYIFERYREPIGYGQILKVDNKYFLVNFGIVAEYRNHGYGFYFLHNLIRECAKADIDNLYLSVNKYNTSAINLYKKIGFKETYNTITLKFN
jgi:ribosomal protein S18 acetylase RimI-like enzyme